MEKKYPINWISERCHPIESEREKNIWLWYRLQVVIVYIKWIEWINKPNQSVTQ